MRRNQLAIVVRVPETEEDRITAAAEAHFSGNKSFMLRTALELLLVDIEAGTYPPKPTARTYAARRARIHRDDDN
jgi:hypothetical protein